MKKFLSVLLIGAICGYVSAQDAGKAAEEAGAKPAQKAEEGGKPGRPQPPRDRGARGGRQQMRINQIEQQMNEIAGIYDLNKDGVLDEAERKAMEAELDPAKIQKKLRQAQAYRQFKAIDTDGDMKLSAEEKAAGPEKLQELFRQGGMGGRPGMGFGMRPGAEGGRGPGRGAGRPGNGANGPQEGDKAAGQKN